MPTILPAEKCRVELHVSQTTTSIWLTPITSEIFTEAPIEIAQEKSREIASQLNRVHFLAYGEPLTSITGFQQCSFLEPCEEQTDTSATTPTNSNLSSKASLKLAVKVKRILKPISGSKLSDQYHKSYWHKRTYSRV